MESSQEGGSQGISNGMRGGRGQEGDWCKAWADVRITFWFRAEWVLLLFSCNEIGYWSLPGYSGE